MLNITTGSSTAITEIANSTVLAIETDVFNKSSPQPRTTPQMVRPFGKMSPRKSGSNKRKKGKSQIFTDTPIKNALEAEMAAKRKPSGSKKSAKRQLIIEESSDSEVENDTDMPICDDSSEVSYEDPNEETVLQPSVADVTIDDHVLVRLPSKNSYRYFVGRIKKVNKKTFDIQFMERVKGSKTTSNVFHFTSDEIFKHGINDLVAKLPFPTRGTTARSSHQFTFHSDVFVEYTLY